MCLRRALPLILKKVEKICNLSTPKDKGVGDKEYIGTRKLLQALHKELLCNNSLSTATAEKVSPLQVG